MSHFLWAQTLIDGRTAYYDETTDTYLISVTEDYQLGDVPDGMTVETTYLPIIQLVGEFSTAYSNGTISISEPDGETNTYSMKAKYRGGSTNTADRHKRNFHIKLLDGNGDKLSVALLGLRKDNSFLLDAGQIDLGRIRNRVAHEIWRDMGNAPYYIDKEEDAMNYIRGEFAEVFIGERYFGLYSLTEALDRKQMQLKKYDEDTGEIRGLLYKADGWTYTGMYGPFDEYDNTSDTWGSFELEYPEIDDVCPTDWGLLYDALMFVDESSEGEFSQEVGERFDIPVLVDFYLFNNVVGATDHGGKNMYWACYDKRKSQMLTLAIWDYDTMIGQTWDDNDVHSELYGPETGEVYTHAGPQVLYRLMMEDVDGFVDKVLERYWGLRQTVFERESLTAHFDNYFDFLRSSGTLAREEARWSGDTDIKELPLDFDYEQEYINDWLTRRLTYLDEMFTAVANGVEKVENLTDKVEDVWYNLSGQRVDETYRGIVVTQGKKFVRR